MHITDRVPSGEIGRVIMLERTVKGLGQGELASRVGIPGERLCKIERGKMPVSLREVARILAALDATPSRYLGVLILI